MTTKTELQDKVKELQAQIDAMPDDKPKGRWRPKRDELYYIHTLEGNIDCTRWYADVSGERSHAIGNCFKTKEAAEQHVENLKVHYELMDLADFQPDWNDGDQWKHHLVWSWEYEVIKTDSDPSWKTPRTASFRTAEDALAAASKVGAKRVEMYLKGE